MTIPVTGHDITGLLLAWGAGNQQAFDQLVPVVYDELRRIARRYIDDEAGRSCPASHCTGSRSVSPADRRQPGAMAKPRSFLWSVRESDAPDSGRLRALPQLPETRRPGATHALDGEALLSPERAPDLIELDDALERLAAVDARKSRVVELRFFGGLTVEETARCCSCRPDCSIRLELREIVASARADHG